jgi:hypothetical protein
MFSLSHFALLSLLAFVFVTDRTKCQIVLTSHALVVLFLELGSGVMEIVGKGAIMIL